MIFRCLGLPRGKLVMDMDDSESPESPGDRTRSQAHLGWGHWALLAGRGKCSQWDKFHSFEDSWWTSTPRVSAGRNVFLGFAAEGPLGSWRAHHLPVSL